MAEHQIRLRVPKLVAWQWTPGSAFPSWVARTTEMNQGELVLVRKSGRQVINTNDWLAIDDDSSIVHLSNASIQSRYDVL